MTARAKIRVLGIDPGTASTGFGIVESHAQRLSTVCGGVISTGSGVPVEQRLAAIAARLNELLDEHSPDALAIEEVYFGRNVRSAFAVGQARGVVLLAAAQHGRTVREATPNEVKSAITGYGGADKEQVQRMVQLVLGMSELPRPDDAADALAIATWAANTERYGPIAKAGVLDRAAVAPITRGQTGYERAVHAAIAGERAAKRSAS